MGITAHPTEYVSTKDAPPWRPRLADGPTFLTAAQTYRRRGWHPIPQAPGTKAPPRGVLWSRYKDRPPTDDELATWASRWPRAGVALVTGATAGLAVLDYDTRNGAPHNLSELDAHYGVVGAGPVVATGGGGFHRYCAVPQGVVLRDVTKLAPGLDLKAQGIVIAAPSLHESGNRYRWVEGTEGLALPELPTWVLDLYATHKAPTTGRAGHTSDGAPIGASLAAEFRDLWASEGVVLGQGDRNYSCPWHGADRNPSLSIDAERGTWFCHAGCGGGGVRDLRERIGPVRARVSLRTKNSLATPIEESARPLADELRERCGILVAAVVNGRRQVRPLPCHQRTCPSPTCGPVRAERHAAPVLSTLERGGTLHELVLTPCRVRAVLVRLGRAGADYKRYPMRDGRVRVFTTYELGAPVEDPERAMRDAFTEAAPLKGRNITASKAWQVTKADEEGTPTGVVEWLGVITASPQWVTRQTYRITGHAMVPITDAAGRVVGAVCAIPEASLTPTQRAELDHAWGIVPFAEWNDHRREHQGEQRARRLLAAVGA